MTKKKSFLGLYFAISLVFIVVAVVLSLTVGLNLSIEIGGGTQFEVEIENYDNVKKQTDAIKSVLNKNGLSVEDIFVEEKGVDKSIVVRVNKTNLKESLREDIAKKLEIDVEKVSEFSNISGIVTKKAVLWASVALIIALLLLFVGGWLRYKLISGLTLMFTFLHTILVSLSLLVITQLPIGFVSLLVVLLATALAVFAMVLTLERLRENVKLKHYEDLEPKELVYLSRKQTLKPLAFIAALILIFSIVLVWVPVRFVTFICLSIILCVLASAYSYYFVSVDVHAYLFDLRKTQEKMRLTKNPSVASGKPAKENKKKVKDEKAKIKAAKAKEKEIKAKMKQKKEQKDQPVV